MLLYALPLFFAAMTTVWCQHYEDTKRIFNVVLGSDRYHSDVRPVVNQADAVIVKVDFELISIIEVNDIRQSFLCNGLINLFWMDERAVWNVSDYGGVTHIHPSPKQIWRPRVVLVNTLDERDLFQDDISPITLAYDGTVQWFPGSLFPTSCKLDLTKYPFDEQQCYIRMLPMALRTEELTFVAGSVFIDSFTVSGVWELANQAIVNVTVALPNGSLSSFEVRFHLRRRPVFFMLNILLPVVLLSFLNIMVFVIPVDSGEKISYGITVLLALTVFMSIVSSMLPQSSDTIPHVVIYLFSLLIVSLLTVIDTIVIVVLHHMEARTEKSMKARKLFKSAISQIRPTSRGSDSRDLDTTLGSNQDGQPFPNVTRLDVKSIKGQGHRQVKKDSWVDVMKAIDGDEEPGKSNEIENEDTVNKYKMIGKHIDMVSFVVFTIIWVIVTLWFFIAISS